MDCGNPRERDLIQLFEERKVRRANLLYRRVRDWENDELGGTPAAAIAESFISGPKTQGGEYWRATNVQASRRDEGREKGERKTRLEKAKSTT